MEKTLRILSQIDFWETKKIMFEESQIRRLQIPASISIA